MFKKLKNNIDVGEYTKLEEKMNYDSMIDGEFRGLSYAYIGGPATELMSNLIPERYRNFFYFSSMTANDEIPPHTDNEIVTTINFYIDPQNCITQFYKFRSKNPTKYPTPSPMHQNSPALLHDIHKHFLQGGHRFDKSDLDETSSFVAQPNEVYVLDVTQPHGVKPLGEFKLRTSVTLATEIYDFDHVCKMLQETGNL